MKICNKCNETKPASEEFFYRHSSGKGLQNVCKQCCNKIGREWRKNNKKKSCQYRLKHRYKKEYGLTVEQEKLIKAGGCQACGSCVGQMNIDHDHTKPGTYRGCLCSGCNIALGQLKDSELRILQLYTYIQLRR